MIKYYLEKDVILCGCNLIFFLKTFQLSTDEMQLNQSSVWITGGWTPN